MNPPKVISVQAIENKSLLVEFIDGTKKIYDCAQVLGFESFKLLNKEPFFKSVKVDTGGYGISWNDEIDLSEYELWTNGIDVG